MAVSWQEGCSIQSWPPWMRNTSPRPGGESVDAVKAGDLRGCRGFPDQGLVRPRCGPRRDQAVFSLTGPPCPPPTGLPAGWKRWCWSARQTEPEPGPGPGKTSRVGVCRDHRVPRAAARGYDVDVAGPPCSPAHPLVSRSTQSRGRPRRAPVKGGTSTAALTCRVATETLYQALIETEVTAASVTQPWERAPSRSNQRNGAVRRRRGGHDRQP
jgi:hypothetical protein